MKQELKFLNDFIIQGAYLSVHFAQIKKFLNERIKRRIMMMKDKLKVCKLLGLEPYQKFRIKDDIRGLIYRFNENGERETRTKVLEREHYIKTSNEWFKSINEDQLCKIICDPDLIEVVDDEIMLNLHDTIVLKGVISYYGEKIDRIDRVDNVAITDINPENNKGEYVQVFFADHKPNKEHYMYIKLDLDFLEDYDNYWFRVEYDENDNIRVYAQ